MNPKILIVGYGNIGKHIYDEFKALKPDIYDPFIKVYSTLKKITYDFAFICVPTDKKEDGSCDTSIVEKTVKLIDSSLIIIKSTIPPSTTKRLIKDTKKHLVFSPENYGVTQHCKKDPGFAIIGSENKEDRDKVVSLYSLVKDGYYRYGLVDTLTAELAKYMLNSFLALKVTFCNEFNDLAKLFDVSYNELRELFIMDSRISPSHTYVYPSKPYYDSHCFNKDIPALLAFSKGTTPLIKKMNEINLEKKNAHRKG